MPRLVENGHLYLALPPLYRLTQGETTIYARDDAHREALLASAFRGRGKIEVNRFKGLGEMPARYLWATTMDPARRTLLRVTLPTKPDPVALAEPDEELERTRALVETLMGRRPELRFAYIQKNARFARDLDV
jgi:topoisomerase-4 subunit B